MILLYTKWLALTLIVNNDYYEDIMSMLDETYLDYISDVYFSDKDLHQTSVLVCKIHSA